MTCFLIYIYIEILFLLRLLQNRENSATVLMFARCQQCNTNYFSGETDSILCVYQFNIAK